MKTGHDKDENHVLKWADRLGVQVRSLAVRPMRNSGRRAQLLVI